jgi:hypothetical protein
MYGKRLAAEATPNVDVTNRVLDTVRRDRSRPNWAATVTRPLAFAAAAAWLIAVTCGLFAQQAWTTIDDPLGALFSPFVVSLQ